MENLEKYIENIKNNNSVIEMSEILKLNLTEEEFTVLLKLFKNNNIVIIDLNQTDQKEEEEYSNKGETEDIETMYLREAKRHRVLTKEEERELIPKAKRGLLKDASKEDKRALNKFVSHNQRLVISVTAQYNKTKKLEFLDAIQEGNLGLLRAIQGFDLSTNYKFSTYATWWIKQAVTRAVSEKSRLIRMPVHRDELVKQINRYEAVFLQEENRRPTPSEIALNFGISEDVVNSIRLVDAEMARLDSPLPNHTGEDEDESLLGQFIASDENVEEQVIQKCEIEDVKNYINSRRFGKRERQIFEERIINGKTLEELGAELHITRERVRQIEKKVRFKLGRYEKMIENDFKRHVEGPQNKKK